MADPFERLAPFLREFLWDAGWASLRQIQSDAITEIFDSTDDLLLCASTASGKTEAAFLPILSKIQESPQDSVQAIYVGPLKALINDQFERLEDLCRKAEIPVTRWHGDVTESRKNAVLEHPAGVLQITPESIESLLLNRARFLGKILAKLQFVVIDEVHTFLDSDRGLQLRCQLERLQRYVATGRPRRVGLSATLGDPSQAQRWLNSAAPDKVRVLTTSGKTADVKFRLDHFVRDGRALPKKLLDDLFALTRNARCLIFCNSRADVEVVSSEMNRRCSAEKLEDRYLAHHGSISKEWREDAEARMKHASNPCSVVCTSTLEMGIDIGKIDFVVQIDATSTVSSMVQRLGRSGRRAGQAQVMQVYTTEREDDPLGIPFSLLQALAASDLWLEKWVEPARERKKPFHVLYQQLMSMVTERNGMRAGDLVRALVATGVFPHVTPEEYELLIRHLAKTDHLQQMSDGTLIPGLAGEKIVRGYDFYAMFRSSPDSSVVADGQVIGHVSAHVEPGKNILLAGRVWKVREVRGAERAILVEPAGEGEKPSWTGVGGAAVHAKVVERAREILFGGRAPAVLPPEAKKRLEEARAHAREFAGRSVIGSMVLPWLGSVETATLAEILAVAGLEVHTDHAPWVLQVKGDLKAVAANPPKDVAARVEAKTLLTHKFDEYLPEVLLRRRHEEDELALDPALKFLAKT